jgi:hypothetical protein
LISAGGISALLFTTWNFHCHRIYAEAEFPTVNMDSLDGKSGVYDWYFGTMAYRLNFHNWLRGGWHLITMVFGGLSFVFLLLISTRLKKSAEAWLWLLAAVCTTLVFTTLLFGHLHYFFVFAPATAWLCAVAATEVEPQIWNQLRVSAFARGIILLVTIAASLAGTLMIIHINMYFDPYQNEVAQLIKQHTAPEDKIVVWGMVWGDPFLKADRQGVTGNLHLANTGWINDPEKLQRLKQLGYRKIVLINPSSFIVALTSVTGKQEIKITDLHQCLPSVAKNWPVVFDSAQILIVQIPG